MRRLIICLTIAMLFCSSIFLHSNKIAYAETPEDYDISIISIAIAKTINELEISNSGIAQIVATTTTLSGYTAKVNAELQRKSGSTWTTIKSYSNSGSPASITKKYTVGKL